MASLQQLVNDRASDPNSSRCTIVVSVALFECIAQFRLGAADLDNILDGITPFLVCPPYYHRAAGTRLEVNTYGLLTSGSGTATMSDIRELSDPKLQAPRDALELYSFVGGYSCLVDVLIGEGHAAAARLRDHATFWREHAPALSSMVGPENLASYLLRIMRSIQLITVGYVNTALRSGTAALLPDYGRIEEAVRNRTLHNLSPLPLRYLEEKAAPAIVKSPPAAVAPVTGASTVATTPATRLSVRVDAPKSHQQADWISKFASSTKEIKVLKLDATRPKVCLSYHLRSTCFESCRENSSHRALTAPEKATFQTWLDKAL